MLLSHQVRFYGKRKADLFYSFIIAQTEENIHNPYYNYSNDRDNDENNDDENHNEIDRL
jgi:hypothetical protein